MTAAVLAPRIDDRALGYVMAALVVVLALAPVLGLPPFVQSLVIEIMIFSILAMSLDLLVGYTGLVSFGHAAFFAIAGYGTAVAARATPELLLTIPVGLLAALVLALLVGWLSIRLSGFYFLMITFAFAQMVYVAAIRLKKVTGGSDGLVVPGPKLFGYSVLESRAAFYWFTLAVFVLCCGVMYAVVRSQFGRTLVGIREQTPRMRALGYDVRWYKLVVFVIASLLAGAAGIVNVLFNLFIAPESAHWTQSALAHSRRFPPQRR